MPRRVALAVLACTLVAACDSGEPVDDAVRTFVGNFAGLNGASVSGTYQMLVGRDRVVTVTLDALGVHPDTVHAQYLHSRAQCPTSSDDENEDGFVDIVEAEAVTGPVALPLDSDLSTREAELFPTARSDGSIAYSTRVPLDTLLANLGGTAAALNARSVLILGTDPATELPATVQSAGGQPAYTTLPVACAEVFQIGN